MLKGFAGAHCASCQSLNVSRLSPGSSFSLSAVSDGSGYRSLRHLRLLEGVFADTFADFRPSDGDVIFLQGTTLTSFAQQVATFFFA